MIAPTIPTDWANPNWEKSGLVHDWKNHVGYGVRAIWSTFTDMQKQMIAADAQDRADREHWD